MRFLITGTAGFIGFHLARRLLADGHIVAGVDGFTGSYDVGLKRARHAELAASSCFLPREAKLEDFAALCAIVERDQPDVIIHLAAQTGVRGAFKNPRTYADCNLVGAFNIFELARKAEVRHLLFASTSAVYGAACEEPFRETMRTDHPLSLYAATKKAAEDMAHAYAHLWKMPTTALRIFTAYGPWGRPDMAVFKFVRAAFEGEPIDVYGEGKMSRDFTFIDDLVDAIVRLVDCPPREGAPIGPLDSLSPVSPYRVVNVGAGQPVAVRDVIAAIEGALGGAIEQRLAPIQKGEVWTTWASNELLRTLTGVVPSTSLQAGIAAFVAWYRNYYRL